MSDQILTERLRRNSEVSVTESNASRSSVLAGPPAWAIVATLVLVVASIAVGVAAALTRGPWLDEFWTLWATDPTIPWQQALQERWLTDVHPPAFSAFSRLLAGLLGPEVTIRRLQNLLPLLGLLGAFVYAAMEWPRARRFLATYAVLAFSSYFMTAYLAEYRSYFAQFCFGLVFYGSGYALLSGELELSTTARRVAAGALLVTSVLLVNLHFVTAIVALISLAGLMLAALAFRQRQLAVLFCVAGFLSTIPLAVTTMFQLHQLLGRTGGHFWIETGVREAVTIVAGSFVKGVGCSLIAVVAAILTLGRRAGRPNAGIGRDRQIGLIFAGLAAGSALVLLGINLQTPIIIDRYLVLCSAAMVCGLAILAKDILFDRRWGFVLLLANAAAFIAVSGLKLVREPRWNATAELIAGAVTRCPATRVEAFQFLYPGTLPNEAAVLSQAYRYLGDRHGFAVQAAGLATFRPPNSTSTCGDILWVEHLLWPGHDPDTNDRLVRDAARRALGPIDLSRTVVLRAKTGAIIVPAAEQSP
ncbi:hypothetical protein HN018_18305 [Lichenicola cladoniae]|uniref:Glycosyltransferase RgtA/B/C/D-like domain-containing protein n=1 Tax=Lichenicola cladoniae TaxID=1484109 RepID=A0A6M8HT80_9PROT|nr:hypothetical protein [Lichenicola cladoniae]NPD67636.1 hypothetical protein [Acetobacteraceae bacterium]QKE91724.1 hypothetical protein HN018_18305 [Lichenicola cladoniae]